MTGGSTTDACPCGRGPAFERCCAPLLRGDQHAATAEALMRSRYTAYAVGDGAHLLRSWASTTRPRHVAIDRDTEWTGLVIRATTGGAMLDQEGTVSFEAHHRSRGAVQVLRETSRFVREDGRWVYEGPS